jgi:orotate phosphoribosyltransferase-like protein
MSASPPVNRTPEQIRASIEANRAELGAAVERLRAQATELADWRGHLRRHRTEVLIGAAMAGFVLGGGIAAMAGRLRRRRR